MKKTHPTKEELSWILYDVGNSAFVLVMVTAIMPIFFVALWWLAFALPTLKNVKQKYAAPPSPAPIKKAFSRLWRTFAEIRRHRQAFYFLVAYFFYIDGVDTIISMSTA